MNELLTFDPDEVARRHGEAHLVPHDAAARRGAVVSIAPEMNGDEPPVLDPNPNELGPRFSVDDGVYTVAWGDPVFVRIEFERFDAGSRGELTSEIRIATTAPGLERQLHVREEVADAYWNALIAAGDEHEQECSPVVVPA